MKILFSFLLIVFAGFVNAQQFSAQVERSKTQPLYTTINFSDTTIQDWQPFLLTVKEQPREDEDYIPEKEVVNAMRRQHHVNTGHRSGQRSNTPAPVMLNNFIGNNAQGTPNDNHIAISDSGIIVSVANTNIKMYNDTGLQLYSKSLSAFANVLGVLQSVSDPRIVYDPATDRFILIFFSGVASTTSKVVVGFSKTNNPTGAWNFYKLSGNYLSDTTWSDYPIVTISDHDLFVTFNQLHDSLDWQTGFKYSIIWQIDKSTGYNGDTLLFNYWHNIEYNGRPVWNICPIRGGSGPTGPETYLLSVRPHDISNDTVFLHTISNSVLSGNAQLSTKVLTTNVPYGLPPNVLQKNGQYLATNDARILDGFYQNGKIQYVQNTVDPQTMTSAVYSGEIDLPYSANPIARGTIISYDSIDLGYPSIAYIGNNAYDDRAVITCSYSPTDTFPGTVAFYKDAGGNISDMLVVKSGAGAVNVLADSVERWGDYTGVQRKYNEPNTAWLAGSYGSPFHQYYSWIAKVVNTDSTAISSVNELNAATEVKIFPNPATDKFTARLDIPGNNYLQFALYNMNGQMIRVLLEDSFAPGTGVFSFSTQYLAAGTYLLRISNHGNLLRTEKVVVIR